MLKLLIFLEINSKVMNVVDHSHLIADSLMRMKYDRIILPVGLMSGTSGVALSLFYYAIKNNNQEIYDYATRLLKRSLAYINDASEDALSIYEASRIGWMIEHLEQYGFITIDTDSLLIKYDRLVFETIMEQLSKENYDLLGGASGMILYLLKRINSKNGEINVLYLNEIGNEIYKIGHLDEKNKLARWQSPIYWGKPFLGINLSMSHGMAGLIVILSKIFRITTSDETNERIRRLMLWGTNFILRQKKLSIIDNSMYPSYSLDSTMSHRDSRLAWCYGDLGIAFCLQEAGKALNEKSLIEEAKLIFKHSCNRRTSPNTLISDHWLCHGASGVAYFFTKAFQFFKDLEFQEAANFWLNKTNVLTENYYNKSNKTENNSIDNIGLLNGVSGLLLHYNSIQDPKYQGWDEILLLNT